MRRTKLLVLPLTIGLLISSDPTTGRVTTPILPLNADSFESVVLDQKEPNLVILDAFSPKYGYFRPKIDQKEPKLEVLEKPISGEIQVGTNSLKGKASYFCNYDTSRAPRSSCHYKYPDRVGRVDLYAAACASLRSAMGSWRGKTVTVSYMGNSINVKLIDYCASKTKVIDLYFDAFKAVSGKKPNVVGVIPVTINWK